MLDRNEPHLPGLENSLLDHQPQGAPDSTENVKAIHLLSCLQQGVTADTMTGDCVYRPIIEMQLNGNADAVEQLKVAAASSYAGSCRRHCL